MDQHPAEQSALEETIGAYAQGRSLDDAIAYWANVQQQYEQLAAKRRELQNAKEHSTFTDPTG